MIGTLIIVYSLTDNSSVYYNFVPREAEQLRVVAVVMGLPDDQYNVSIFVIDESGLPFPRAAASPRAVQIDGNEMDKSVHYVNCCDLITVETQQPSPIEYELRSTSTGVCITCTFLDSSATDCVAVVHQRISQLSPNGLMNIESSHKFNRSGDTASGCIEGVSLEMYQVGVIGARATRQIMPSGMPIYGRVLVIVCHH